MITKDIIYVGVNDHESDLFEGQYEIPNGIAYNSYVILDEKVAVMDTVDHKKCADFLANVKEALNGRTPDYLVVHHMEPDHASSIGEFLKVYPDTQIVTSAGALKMMPLYFSFDTSNVMVVKEGDVLNLGRHNLQFIGAPMVHWPEVIMSFDTTDKVLFSADAFGKFGALDYEEEWDCEARRYYFNIVGKFGPQVLNVLKKAAPLGIEIICPLHGPILSDTIPHVLSLYQTWASYGVETEGVFIAYTSMHGNTAVVAEKLAEILREKGCPKVAVTDLAREDHAEAVEDGFRYGKIVLAAPSYNAGLMPIMMDYLNHLKLKNWQKKTVALIENGSFAPSAVRTMKEMLSTMKDITVLDNSVTIMGAMKDEYLPALNDLADQILA